MSGHFLEALRLGVSRGKLDYAMANVETDRDIIGLART